MLRRFGAALSAIICLSLGLQALGLDLLSLRGLYPIDGPGGVALRLALLGVGLWLWVGLPAQTQRGG